MENSLSSPSHHGNMSRAVEQGRKGFLQEKVPNIITMKSK